jgi:hypothetical protein
VDGDGNRLWYEIRMKKKWNYLSKNKINFSILFFKSPILFMFSTFSGR